MDSLDQIKADILKQDICPNLAQTATQIVMGEGSLDAKIVFVGEAPGKNEDISGTPFVGRAGKILDENLKTIGLERKDVFITNIVKYRPPNNRDPKPQEIDDFMPYLIREIELINPVLIAPLGRHAASVFISDLVISRDHGKVFNWKGRSIVPLYHPAALIYNRKLIPENLNDLELLKKLINGN